jgi:alpha-galactosidase
MRRSILRQIAFTCVLSASIRPVCAAPIVATGDASIAHDGTTWTVSAGGSTLTLAFGPSRDFDIVRLATASNIGWTIGTIPDTTITVSGQALAFGSRAAGFSYISADAFADGTSLQLDAIFQLPKASLRLTRHYRVTSGSPTFEIWTTFAALGGAPSASNLNAFHLAVPPGTIHWLTGLEGDNADLTNDKAFTLQRTTLASDGHFAIGAQARASEQSVPWVAIDGTQDELYAALMWSGAWSLTANRVGDALALDLGLSNMTTAIRGAPVDGPHVLLGVVPGGLPQATAALRSYIINGLRKGVAYPSLVTYNTWFAYGTNIDDASMRAEMDHAAALGTEMFVVDAGWYAGAGAAGPFDFDAGLGSWSADPARFPEGLEALTQYAHSLGMKFGLWVEPERVNLSQVGAAGIDEALLATVGGHYGSDHAAQVCLSSDVARQYLFDRLTRLVDEVKPDYLKWDNNMFVNCDRAGPGHGTTDGNFAHVSGLYSLLATLRARYPEMLMENVSGGGNRLDLGMARYTDVAWMDDRTAPSVHVRHNVQGLSVVFPPAYLLSFVTDHDDEPIHDAPDLPLYFRSRMEGALGLCFLAGSLSDDDAAAMSKEIAIYKSMRGMVTGGAGALLTRQAAAQNGPSWDILQQTTADAQQVVVCAVQSDDGVQTFTVRPKELDAGTMYQIVSVDAGPLGAATGADLMADGIELLRSAYSAAHILIVSAKPPP